jgi:hypothetical protein
MMYDDGVHYRFLKMPIWNVFAALSLWLSILTTPAMINAFIPSAVCDPESQMFSLPLCALRLSEMSESADLPIGVCDETHPNFDDNICPKEEFVRGKILYDEMRSLEKKWVKGDDCQCPSEKAHETRLEIWERTKCGEVCRLHQGRSLARKVINESAKLPVCQKEGLSYNQERCLEEMRLLFDRIERDPDSSSHD